MGEGAGPHSAPDQSAHTPNIIRVRLAKAGHMTYGLVLEERDVDPRILVSDVVEGSSAATSGLVLRGDLLLKVNDIETAHTELGFVLELLKGLGEQEPVVFLLQSPEGYAAFLQTIFLADGSSKTVRVTTPIERNRFGGLLSPSRSIGKLGKSSSNGEEKVGSEKGAAQSTGNCGESTLEALKPSPNSIEALSEFLRFKVGLGGTKSSPQENRDGPIEGGKRLHPGGQMKENGTVPSPNQSPKIVLTQAGANSEDPKMNSTAQAKARNNNIEGTDKNLPPERRLSVTSGLETPGSAGRSPTTSRRGSVCTPRRHQKLHFLTEDTIASDTLYNLSVEVS